MVFGVLKLKETVPSELVPTSDGLSSSVLPHTHDLPAQASQINPWALPADNGEPMEGATTQIWAAACGAAKSRRLLSVHREAGREPRRTYL